MNKAWLFVAISAAAWTFGVSKASAQVAAPTLIPFDFVTTNPAVMQWAAPSRAGAAYGQFRQTTDPASVTDDFQFGTAGARWVGEWASAELAANAHNSLNKPYGDAEYGSALAGALAVNIGGFLALGVSDRQIQNRHPNQAQPVGADIDRTTVDLTIAGLSIRLGEWFFLGGAKGRQYVKFEDLTNPANSINNLRVSRDVSIYGAGIRTGGAVLVHAEYYVVDAPDFQDPVFGNFGRANARTGVLELNWSGFLLAYSGTHTENNTNIGSNDDATYTIGYAPATGWTVAAQADFSQDHVPAGQTAYAQRLYALAVTYLFP